MNPLRPNLPPLTSRIEALPVDERGYPVPYFVQWFNADGTPSATRGVGKPDFRVADQRALFDCVMNAKCWVCGQKMGRVGVFVIGPMCVVNRNSGEPPAHLDCTQWSVQACPFLLNPNMVRREAGMPEGTSEAAGIMLKRNPGVMALWSSKTWRPVMTSGGMLFSIGEPLEVQWWCQGRAATRAEVIASLDSGMPSLEALCESEDEKAQLALARQVAESYLPK